MKTGAVIALVAVPVVLGGGVAAFFLLRKRQNNLGMNWQVQPREDARQLAAVQMTEGPRAVATTGGGGGGGVLGTVAGLNRGVANAAVNLAGSYVDKYIPGQVGSKLVGGIVGSTNKVLAKVPGVGGIGKKLGLW